MKKNILGVIIAAVAMAWGGLALANQNPPGGGYDPESPGEPNARYRVDIHNFPSNGGFAFTYNGTLYSEGEFVEAYAFPNTSYQFEGWYENGVLLSKEYYYTFQMPGRSVDLYAMFKVTQPTEPMDPGYTHTVYVTRDPQNGGYTNWSDVFQVYEGESTYVYAYPIEGYKFNGWQIDGVNVAPNPDGTVKNPLLLTMGDKNIHLTVKFAYSPNDPGDPLPNSYNNETFELIIDNFELGNLAGTLNELISDRRFNINRSEIHSFVIAGRMDNEDRIAFFGLSNCAVLDLARTSGIDFIDEWGLSDMEALTDIILPSSLMTISPFTFYSNGNLSTITCYAVTPPYCENEYFFSAYYPDDLINQGIVARVPASSIPLYQDAPGWKYLNLVPIESSDCAITVTLPEDAKDGRYKGMYLVLENPASGQTQRFVINDKMTYVFENLIMNTTGLNLYYNVYLRNKTGDDLASYSEISLTKDQPTASIMFSDIKTSHNLEAKVLQADGKNIADELDIVWKNANGEHVASGVKTSNVVEGKELTVSVSLPDTYGVQYQIPEPVRVVSGHNDNTATIQLVAYPKTKAEGKVTYLGQPIERAYVTVDQLLGGKYKKSVTGVTGKDGKYQLEYIDHSAAAGKVTARAEGYVTQPCEIANFAEWKEMKDFEMKPISGSVITVSLNLLEAGEKEAKTYTDYANVDFSIFNKSKNEDIYNYTFQYLNNEIPVLVIQDDTEIGDDIIVTVSSRSGIFEPAFDVATIDKDDKGEVKIALVEHGKITSSIAGAEAGNVSAVLYNNEGHLVKHMLFDSKKNATFSNLEAGDYTLIAISDSPYFNGVSKIEDFDKYGFVSGKDYLVNKVTVKDGSENKVQFGNVPMFDESQFYFTDPTLTLLKANKTSVTASNYVTLSTRFNFLPAYRGRMENVTLVYELPEHCTYVENSLINGDEPGNLTDEGNNRYSLWNVTPGTTVRFCVMPEKGGNYYPTASIEFDYNGEHYSQALGSVYFQGVDFKLYVPRRTSREFVYARGVAPAASDVTVFVQGGPSGGARAAGNGEWVTEVPLYEPKDHPQQEIYGEISTPNKGSFPTESTVITYDPYYPELIYARMVHNGYAVDFDHTRVKTSSKSYSYNPSRDMFTLTAKFDENKERVQSVTFHIRHTDGSERTIDAVYSPSNDAWVAALGYPDSFRLPVNVTVGFTYKRPSGATSSDTDFFMDYIAPDVQPIIDPSGFVYEAEEDNRVEGATVTVFHRQGVENIYGDIEWQVAKWNAAEYGQENPLYTDKEGVYGWDVPSGDWQVKFEKDGYETAYSEWLPVPPPQLEVNMGLVRNDAPDIEEVHAYAASNGVEIKFDHYMDINSFDGNIYLTKKNPVPGEPDLKVNGKLTKVHKSSSDSENSSEEELNGFVNSIRFVPEQSLASTTGEVRLVIARKVKSYAGIQMAVDYNEPLYIEKEITGLAADVPTIEINAGDVLKVVVSATPDDAAKGKVVRIKNQSEYILTFYENVAGSLVYDEKGALVLTLNDKGQAEFFIHGLLAGQSQLDMTIDGSNIVGSTPVDVKNEVLVLSLPTASIPDKATVYRGALAELYTKHADATIYYTTDGSDPTPETGIRYTKAFAIDKDMVVKAIAVNSSKSSEIAIFEYKLKTGKMDLSLAEGWSWVSHNMEKPAAVEQVCNENVARVLSQTAEVTRDAKYGFLGNLKELAADQAYKIQSSNAGKISLEDVAYNPGQPFSVEEGWNWIGYPVDQIMTLDEAFAATACEDGDYIETLEGGFATYSDGKWLGNLNMKPGLGYLYRSVSAKDINYSTGIVSEAAARISAPRRNSSSWVVDRNRYPSLMPVIAEVIRHDGSVAEEGEYQVGAFCGSECRGVGEYVEGYLFLSVYGNPGDMISFRLIPEGADGEIELAETIEFTEEPVGSLLAPYQLDTKSTGVKAIKNDSEVKVAVNHRMLTVAGSNVTYVGVFDIDGNKVLSTVNVDSPIALDVVNVGVYIIAVENSGEWSYHKVMVR